MASKDISEHMLSPMVEVTVGEGSEKQLYHLHLSLLCEVSEYFRGCLGGGFTEATSRKTALPDINPTAFAVFVKWAYTEELVPSTWDPSAWNSTGSIEDLQESLVDIYVVGDRLLCSGVKNRAVDIMQATHIPKHVSIKCLIKLVHAGLAESKMAAYLVEQLAYDMNKSGMKLYSGDPQWSDFLTADGKLTSKLLETMLDLKKAQAEVRTARQDIHAQQQGGGGDGGTQGAMASPLAYQRQLQQVQMQMQLQQRLEVPKPQYLEGCKWHEHADGKDHDCKRWPAGGEALAFARLRK